MNRKPVSLTVAPNGCLYVIANDGTIWFRHPPRVDWIQIESIPQPEPSEKPLTSGEVREQMLRERYGVYVERAGEL